MSGISKKKADGKSIGHGWFMLVAPRDVRIVGVSCVMKPENNDIARTTLSKVLPKYKNVDTFIFDGQCSFAPSTQDLPEFKQVKYWSVDKILGTFHGHGHKDACKNNPHTVVRLKRRLKNVNTSICEQTWSWFRNYARILNSASPQRHVFKVLYFCKLHNLKINGKNTAHLNPFGPFNAKFNKSKPYGCPKKSVRKTVMKKPSSKCGNTVMKKPSSKCGNTVMKKPSSKCAK
ncbi:unnamed protein product [Effrenium voratum]|uniref:Transposase n=1 Tax=Effrenium voratum TaxID=2562239 RepID=A0AA36HJM0_9DINO|nr:unnamed protein product [Effrenium voratum]